ncbi:hypothetical protein WICPIJ_003206 [Wickerhamomyces pijperi]|uniref:Uncharacterized protein n=1 Tax=Wickerhamomyces pijperi TaxID=599730 RepID=A0A9P8TP35_WICPI|nr:hypothetical protein WICPIJ_003206 [Wickerhamomyces pijperi]
MASKRQKRSSTSPSCGVDQRSQSNAHGVPQGSEDVSGGDNYRFVGLQRLGLNGNDRRLESEPHTDTNQHHNEHISLHRRLLVQKKHQAAPNKPADVPHNQDVLVVLKLRHDFPSVVRVQSQRDQPAHRHYGGLGHQVLSDYDVVVRQVEHHPVEDNAIQDALHQDVRNTGKLEHSQGNSRDRCKLPLHNKEQGQRDQGQSKKDSNLRV